MKYRDWHNRAVELSEKGMSKHHEMVGKIFPTNNGGDCVVVEYINARNVTVMFLDEYKYTKKTQAVHVREGRVLNPFYPSIYGVGFIGTGKHKASFNRKDTKIYKDWASMIGRGYCSKTKKKYPTYKDCTVCKEWHNFQNFAEWAVQQPFYGLGYQLDKDILVRGNKLYSPETCCYVPQQINKLVLARNAKDSKEKEGNIKRTALVWKDKIGEDVFESLMNWTVD